MPDHIEARMNFIIEQQAQFATDIHLLKDRQAEAWRMIEEHSGMLRQLVDVSLSLAHHMEEVEGRLGARLEQIAEAQAHTDRRLDALVNIVDKTGQDFRVLGQETDRRLRELAESGAHTDRRLDALIDTVDKLARRNGP